MKQKKTKIINKKYTFKLNKMEAKDLDKLKKKPLI